MRDAVIDRTFFRRGTSHCRWLFTVEKALLATCRGLLAVLSGCRLAHCVGLEEVHLEPLAAHLFLLPVARIFLPATPVQASCPPFFSKIALRAFCLQTTWHRGCDECQMWARAAGRGRYALPLLQHSSSRARQARCNVAEGGGGLAHVETACGLFSILLLRPKAGCMIWDSKIK